MQDTTSTETSTTTSRSSRRLLRPDEIINQLRKDYPKASAAQLGELYKNDYLPRVEYEDDQTAFEDMFFISYWLKRELVDPKQPAPRPTRTPEEKAKTEALRKTLAAQIRERDHARIETAIKVRLLTYETTYGKALGDCTGAECLRLSRRYGSFFAEVSKRMSPSEKVINHLTEAELQAIAATHKLVGPEALR